jgi:hypothetical protein
MRLWYKNTFSKYMNLIRTIFLILLGIYSLQFFTWDVNGDVMNAFIHGPNLIFHEAGHVLFMPFGDFLSILGGSMFQILLPLGLTYVFYFREENPFAASVTLWWVGQNLTDVALYISDAGARSLPLIGGMSEEAHDWGNLLTMMNLLEYDHALGIFTHYIGMIVMLVGLVWGGYICLREHIA